MGFQADFSEAVRAARKRAGLSQTQLAQRSDVHLNTVSLLTTLNLSLHMQAVGMPSWPMPAI